MRSKLKQLIWQWRGMAIAVPSVTLVVFALRFAGLLQMLEWAAFDQFLRWRPAEPLPPRIAIVGLGEEDIARLGQWPISDATLAELIQAISEQQPAAIGLDVYRDLPVEPGHDTLLDVYESTPNLVGIQKVVANAGAGSIPAPPKLRELGQVAANDLVYDSDGKVRRALLYLESREGEIFEGLGLRLARLYLARYAEITPQAAETNPNYLQLGSQVFPHFESNNGGYVRANDRGYQIVINYRGGRGTFPIVSTSAVLDGRIPDDFFRDRVVLIGSTAQSLNDYFHTPFSSSLVTIPELTSGVEIHANVVSHILSSVLDRRAIVRVLPEGLEGVVILASALIGAALAWQRRGNEDEEERAFSTLTLFVLMAGTILGGSYIAFWNGWWLPVVPSFLALSGSATAVAIYLAYTAGQIRKTFGRYLTDNVVSTLLEDPEGLKMGGQRRRIAILTSDLRGFTAISESITAEKVVVILNLYLGEMAEVITRYGGTIDEFMGDGILVLFGAPIAQSDASQRAIACAVAMQLAMESVNEKMKRQGFPELEMGIGINTGEVVVGNIGSEKRTKYGVVGSNVNLTYRVESYTVGGEILVTEPTLQEAGSEVKVLGQREVMPKGVKQPISIYSIGGIGSQYQLFLPEPVEEIFFELPQPLSVQYTPLDGKHVSKTAFAGTLVKLTEKCAEIRPLREGDPLPAPLTNLKLNLLVNGDRSALSEDFYAKVMPDPSTPNLFRLRMTNTPSQVANRLSEAYQLAGKHH